MQHYDLLYDCDECSDTHPMGVKLELKVGPRRKMSVRAYTTERPLPEAITEFIGSPALCPVTGKHFVPSDLNRIYILPL